MAISKCKKTLASQNLSRNFKNPTLSLLGFMSDMQGLAKPKAIHQFVQAIKILTLRSMLYSAKEHPTHFLIMTPPQKR
jgi:hypothetical protein